MAGNAPFAPPDVAEPDRPLRIAIVTETFLPKIDGIVTRLCHTLRHLRAMGHTVEPAFKVQGDAHSIFYDAQNQTWTGVADPRHGGGAAGF